MIELDRAAAETLLRHAIRDGGLHSIGWYLSWSPGSKATLDGEFTADDLEAIAWWMRNGCD